MKFKVGDIIKGINDDKYSITDTSMYKAEVISTNKDMMGIKILEHKDLLAQGEEYSVTNSSEYFELIEEKQFTKSDIKNGDIVTYRNGEKRAVINGRLIDNDGYRTSSLEYYNNELKKMLKDFEALDIVKIERPSEYETVFERKQEILDDTEKRYLTNIIRPFKNQAKWIKKGKIFGSEYITIKLKNESITLPTFAEGTMYKEMKKDKEYTLKELGL